FPLPMSLLAAKFIGDDKINLCDPRGVPAPSHEEKLFVATVRWLAGSGYLTHDKPCNSPDFPCCVLTPKGLEVLRLVPESLQAPLGAQLADAARSQAAPMLSALVVQVLSAGAQFLAR
ncbi:hypothetical protein EGI20_18705, partial [Aquitalea sp. S1-19]|nr:hypothetical protein [Aquitalea sp. S1-19]